ncbi:MAG TPA: hypothetical protein VIJ52_00725 [Pseudolabrys sp.]
MSDIQTDIPNIIFNGRCELVELSPETLAALTPERRERYEQVRSCAATCAADEAAIVADQKYERDCEDEMQAAGRHLLSLKPKISFLDALKAAQKAYRENN